jgi:biopolymer transport protein ExbD
MTASRRRRQSFTEINITPLTDIFLVLLIIMMVIAPMLDSKGLKLAVPTLGTAPQTTQEPKVMTLMILANGNYQVNGQLIAPGEIQQRFFQTKSQFPDGLVIEAHPDAFHGAVVAIMDAARAAGLEKIAVTSSEKE